MEVRMAYYRLFLLAFVLGVLLLLLLLASPPVSADSDGVWSKIPTSTSPGARASNAPPDSPNDASAI